MKKFIIGQKIGMTQLIAEDGEIHGVTVIEAQPNDILDILKQEDRGYNAVLVGYGFRKKVSKPLQGIYKKYDSEAKRFIKEFRVDDTQAYAEQKTVTVDVFNKDEKVNVQGVTKGRGFAGTIKRHGFSRGPMAHGSKNHRLPGSIGAGTSPSRVVKGKKMAGHYGDENVTIKNLAVVKIDVENNMIYLKGAIPGKNTGIVYLYN